MKTTLLRDEPWPDERCATEALVKLTQGILAVPEHANTINWTFGRRHERVGGAWYWGVTWTMSAGSTEQHPRYAEAAKVLKAATAGALTTIEQHRAQDEATGV